MIKVITLAMILIAAALSGCIGSDDSPTFVTNILGNPADKAADLPITVSFEITEEGLPRTVSVVCIIREDGTAEQYVSGLGDDISMPLVWEKTSDGRYALRLEIEESCTYMTINNDGTVLIESDTKDTTLTGTWKSGIYRAF